MPSKYKLYYFDTAGRSELIRWILAYAGQEFEDIRIKKEDWPALKPSAPNGQLPYLEVDGKKLSQSVAIARFVARKHGLTGKDDFEAAQADALIDFVSDAINKEIYPIVMEKDEAKKSNMRAAFHKETIHPYLKGLERDLQANNNGQGFLVGEKPTWADFGVAFLVDMISSDPHLLDAYPLLKAHGQRVHQLKGIKEWLVKYPVQAKI